MTRDGSRANAKRSPPPTDQTNGPSGKSRGGALMSLAMTLLTPYRSRSAWTSSVPIWPTDPVTRMRGAEPGSGTRGGGVANGTEGMPVG